MEKLRKKIMDAMNEPFVGDYIFSDNELSKIYDLTKLLLRKYDNGESRSTGFDYLIFVAMVNAIKTWNPEKEIFWDCIYKTLLGYRSPKIYNYLKDVIERLGKHGKILYLSGCTKRYYATTLAHAYAPINSTESFLELCWNLYSKDMNFTYTENDDIFELVAKELKLRFSNEKSTDDDLKLGSDVYSLRAGIKQLAIDYPDETVKLIEKTVDLLDRIFNGEILDNNLYYNSVVSSWWAEKEKSFGIEKPKRRNYERAITDYSAIRPKYGYNGTRVILTVPSIRLKSNFYDMPILNIYSNGGELVDRREMHTFGSGITMATKELCLYSDDFVSDNGVIDCTFEIVHCDEVIYNSKETLYRDFILFRNHREISQAECLPGNYVLFAPKFEDFSLYPEEIKNLYGGTNLYTVHSQEGEMLQNSKKTVFFVREKQERSIRIVANIKNKAKFVRNGEEFKVIDGDLKVVVKSDIDITKYGVRYESSNFRLKDFSCSENEEYKTFCITELLNVCEPQKIVIFNYIDNKIEESYNVVKFNNISITYDKKLYFDTQNVGEVRFRTEKYDKKVSFNINQGDVVISLDDGGIVLSPPVLKWKLGDEEFTAQYGKDLWYKNYANSAELLIDLPTELSYQVFLDNNSPLTESASFNSFKLGETIWSIIKTAKKQLDVFVEVENVGIVPILSILLKEKFKVPPFKISDGELIWNASDSFIGERPAKFKVSFYQNGTVKHELDIDERTVENYQTKKFPIPKLELGNYTVSVDLLKMEAFKKVPKRLYEQTFENGSKLTTEWIANKVQKIRVSSVVLEDDSKKSQYTFFVSDFKFVEEKEGKPVFKATIFHFDFNGKKIYDIPKAYCRILSENECEISLDKAFDAEFFWQVGKMISLSSQGGKRIKKYIFVK